MCKVELKMLLSPGKDYILIIINLINLKHHKVIIIGNKACVKWKGCLFSFTL